MRFPLHVARLSVTGIVVLMLACNHLVADGAGEGEDAWRTDLGEFTKRLTALTKSAKVPTEDDFLKKLRIGTHVKLMNKDGVVIFVLDKSPQEGELQAEIDKAFTGRVAWQGAIKSLKKDKQDRSITVEVAVLPPKDTPKHVTIADSLFLTVPATTPLPAKGEVFSFTGNLEKENEKADPPVLVYHGAGPNAGKLHILFSLVGVEPAKTPMAIVEPQKDKDRLPITLSLKDKASNPFNLKQAAPEIVYAKSPDCTATDAAWLVEIDVLENGKEKTYTITAGHEDKKQVLVPLPEREGSFTGKVGSWQQRVELFLAFSDASTASGEGTLRFTLIDSEDFLTKPDPGKARKLAKWLEIPIQLKKSAVTKKPSVQRPKSPEVDREKTAEGKLKLAKSLLKTNLTAAKKRLKEIVNDFDGTEAAKEANKLLNDK